MFRRLIRVHVLALGLMLMLEASGALAASPFRWNTSIDEAYFSDGKHHVVGRMRVTLRGDSDRKRIRLRCHVTATWTRKGERFGQRQREDQFRLVVKANRYERHIYHLTLKDPGEKYRASPRVNSGCR